MALKSRIYMIVAALICVAVIVGGVGIYAMRNIFVAVEEASNLANRVSELKDIRSEIQNALILVREMVIAQDTNRKNIEKAAIDKLIAEWIDPHMNQFPIFPEEQQAYQDLKTQWAKHKDIVARIYENTSANSDVYASALSTGDELSYYLNIEDQIKKIADYGRSLNSPLGKDVALVAIEALERLRGAQIEELLMIAESDAAKIQESNATGRSDLDSFLANINRLGRLLTNPKVSDDELKRYSEQVLNGMRGKVQYRGEGKATYEKGIFTVPQNYYHPELSDGSRMFWNNLMPEVGAAPEFFDIIYKLASSNTNMIAYNILINECNPTRAAEADAVARIVSHEEQLLANGLTKVASDYNSALWVLIVVGAVGLIGSVVFAVIAVTRINTQLAFTIDELTGRANKVEGIAGQLATGSESLAQGANEQASSLESTSSALEETASMTRQNADNAEKMSQTMNETLRLVSEGSGTVQTVTTAMAEISDSAEKIGNIIKTIEEIAFQTNLLALNAAVEAARAGEAGKGFAVVADEVRNLAQRSAQAAKDTSTLISGTVERVQNGSEYVQHLATGFGEIEQASQNVGKLVAEISVATNEQAQGVDQVNTAVAQMDKVTQTNAATAQQSATAASELSEQAINLNSLIQNLALMVYGGHGGSINRPKPAKKYTPSRGGSAPAALPAPSRSSGGSGKVLRPDAVIPLDGDDDFSDF